MRKGFYRGKRFSNGKWHYGSYLYLKNAPSYDWTGSETGKRKDVHFIIDDTNLNYAVDPKTICECTGMTDKTGKMIFEGDIVRDIFNPSVVGIVKYGEYRNTFNDDEYGGHVGFYIEWKEKQDSLRKDLMYWVKNSEFIGNVFDNPELIGE